MVKMWGTPFSPPPTGPHTRPLGRRASPWDDETRGFSVATTDRDRRGRPPRCIPGVLGAKVLARRFGQFRAGDDGFL